MQIIGDLPFGLAVCTANGETVTLTGLSDRQLRLRMYDAEPLLLFDRAHLPCGWMTSREERTALCS